MKQAIEENTLNHLIDMIKSLPDDLLLCSFLIHTKTTDGSHYCDSYNACHGCPGLDPEQTVSSNIEGLEAIQQLNRILGDDQT
jgi:hypothetical protein